MTTMDRYQTIGRMSGLGSLSDEMLGAFIYKRSNLFPPESAFKAMELAEANLTSVIDYLNNQSDFFWPRPDGVGSLVETFKAVLADNQFTKAELIQYLTELQENTRELEADEPDELKLKSAEAEWDRISRMTLSLTYQASRGNSCF
jgi:hypothetical protein